MSVSNLTKRLKGTLVADETDPDADLQDAFLDGMVTFFKASADAMASDASTIGAFKAPFAMRIVGVTAIPNTTLTAHDTNNAVITLAKADGAGGSATAVAALTTNGAGGNWAADTFEEFTVTASAASVTRGQVVTLKITKGGSGVAVPISSYTIRYRRV